MLPGAVPTMPPTASGGVPGYCGRGPGQPASNCYHWRRAGVAENPVQRPGIGIMEGIECV